ncbi:MAG: hypothetical protein ACREIJ_00040 [Nitrospiraceae bacterium]
MRTYTKYRRFERTKPLAALVKIDRVFLFCPLYKAAHRSLGRLILVQWQVWRSHWVSGKGETCNAVLK